MDKNKIVNALHASSGAIKILSKFQERHTKKWPEGVDEILVSIQDAIAEVDRIDRCGAVMAGPNRIVCAEPKGHEGCHKSEETRSEMPSGIRQVHWDDSLCEKTGS